MENDLPKNLDFSVFFFCFISLKYTQKCRVEPWSNRFPTWRRYFFCLYYAVGFALFWFSTIPIKNGSISVIAYFVVFVCVTLFYSHCLVFFKCFIVYDSTIILLCLVWVSCCFFFNLKKYVHPINCLKLFSFVLFCLLAFFCLVFSNVVMFPQDMYKYRAVYDLFMFQPVSFSFNCIWRNVRS